MTDSLMDTSLRTWERMLKERRSDFRVFVGADRIDLSKPEVELSTDDFVSLTMAYAEEIGIDLQEYGRKLVGDREREDSLRFHAGIAFRTIFEVEGYYIEHPYAYTIYKIPTRFLIVVGAALIGIATGKAAQVDPLLGGAVGGVGSLLINILAARYIQPSEDVEITWTEEFILKFLEGRGEQSLKDLQKQTKLYKGTIKTTLERLIEKQLIQKRKVLVGKTGTRTETKYKLKARS